MRGGQVPASAPNFEPRRFRKRAGLFLRAHPLVLSSCGQDQFPSSGGPLDPLRRRPGSCHASLARRTSAVVRERTRAILLTSDRRHGLIVGKTSNIFVAARRCSCSLRPWRSLSPRCRGWLEQRRRQALGGRCLSRRSREGNRRSPAAAGLSLLHGRRSAAAP
jgi:hypothetical protein